MRRPHIYCLPYSLTHSEPIVLRHGLVMGSIGEAWKPSFSMLWILLQIIPSVRSGFLETFLCSVIIIIKKTFCADIYLLLCLIFILGHFWSQWQELLSSPQSCNQKQRTPVRYFCLLIKTLPSAADTAPQSLELCRHGVLQEATKSLATLVTDQSARWAHKHTPFGRTVHAQEPQAHNPEGLFPVPHIFLWVINMLSPVFLHAFQECSLTKLLIVWIRPSHLVYRVSALWEGSSTSAQCSSTLPRNQSRGTAF